MPKRMTTCFRTTAQSVHKANRRDVFAYQYVIILQSHTFSVPFVKAIQSDIKEGVISYRLILSDIEEGVILYRLILNQIFITSY